MNDEKIIDGEINNPEVLEINKFKDRSELINNLGLISLFLIIFYIIYIFFDNSDGITYIILESIEKIVNIIGVFIFIFNFFGIIFFIINREKSSKLVFSIFMIVFYIFLYLYIIFFV